MSIQTKGSDRHDYDQDTRHRFASGRQHRQRPTYSDRQSLTRHTRPAGQGHEAFPARRPLASAARREADEAVPEPWQRAHRPPAVAMDTGFEGTGRSPQGAVRRSVALNL